MQTASAMINSKKDALKEKLKNTALSLEEREKYEKELSQWNAGGLLLNAIGAGLSAPTNSIGGIVAATASPIVSYQIGQYFKGKDAEGSTAHLVAHAVVGAAVAAAGGNNALAGGLAAAGTEALAPVVSKWLYGKESKDLTADEKATVSSIIGLAGAATGAAVGGSMADVAQGNQAGHTAVDNNALRNSKGESKLNTQEKILNEKLKKAGVQSADDYQRKYDACKTDQCRIQVEKEYLKASDEANKIILNLYMTGQITEEESKILLTSYANKMMRGAGESQRRFGSRIFDLNANEWIPASVIGNADFNQITMLNLVKKMKRSGASDEQIAIRVFQYQIAGSYIGSVSIMQQQVDTLLNSGVSVETVIRALSMKKGRRLTNDEIGLIKNRYSVMMQKQGSKAKAGKGTSAVDDVATITSKDKLSGPTANWNNYTHAEAVIKTGNSGKLANADKAVIDPNKVTSYALNTEHPVGGNKAKVFESALGYNQSNANDLISKIQSGAKTNTAILGKADNHGQRITIDMPITGPNGKTATVRTGWIYDPGSSTPRLTTLYVK